MTGGICLFEFKNGNTGAMCNISSKLKIRAVDGVIEQISHISAVFPLSTLNK